MSIESTGTLATLPISYYNNEVELAVTTDGAEVDPDSDVVQFEQGTTPFDSTDDVKYAAIAKVTPSGSLRITGRYSAPEPGIRSSDLFLAAGGSLISSNLNTSSSTTTGISPALRSII